MSKMSQLQMELSEHASELGFDNLQEAIDAGWEANYTTGRLERSEDGEIVEEKNYDYTPENLAELGIYDNINDAKEACGIYE